MRKKGLLRSKKLLNIYTVYGNKKYNIVENWDEKLFEGSFLIKCISSREVDKKRPSIVIDDLYFYLY